ncbi:MAG: toll/interleukin-1 receptor domain-containing protein [Verrucomicrobia bacterium]|nr:toll/interleukin-1 receptor domain-containing protein [Verrucomicrobiota bacterium]
MIPQEVFLSHSSEDRASADRLVSVLRKHGIPVWYSPANILGAQQWHDEIGSALRRCDWFLVLLSPRSIGSVWVKRELFYALQQQRYVNRILPVLSEPCDFEQLSWTLSSLQIINFTNDFDAGSRELLRCWGVGYKTT